MNHQREMKIAQLPSQEHKLFLLLVSIGIVSIAIFDAFFFVHGVSPLAELGLLALGLMVVTVVLAFLHVGIIHLFRASITITFISICVQMYFTGGITSSAAPEFIIPSIVAFSYKPAQDRVVIITASIVCLTIMSVLTFLGKTENLLTPDIQPIHATICIFMLITIMLIYFTLYMKAVQDKNRRIKQSSLEVKKANKKLIQSEKMASLGLLAAGVAHEVNNPLNFIKGGSETLEMELEGDHEVNKEKYMPYLNVINEGVERASVIVNSLNQFSRQSENMDEVCDLHDILRNSVHVLQPKIKKKGKVKLELAEESPFIIGNQGKIHQIFINLISNAHDAIDANGTITLKSKTYKKKIQIWVVDSGTGISKDILPKVTNPFFTTKEVGKGTGLGLSITQNIIDEHGGELKIKSKLGVGSKFVLSFPRFNK